MIRNNELQKMRLLGNWHTEDIDSENISFTVFSTGTSSKKQYIHNFYVVFISRWKQIANKEYAQSCKEQFYLHELLQIM